MEYSLICDAIMLNITSVAGIYREWSFGGRLDTIYVNGINCAGFDTADSFIMWSIATN